MIRDKGGESGSVCACVVVICFLCVSVCVLWLQVAGVKQVDSGQPVKYSTEVLFTADKYEIV